MLTHLPSPAPNIGLKHSKQPFSHSRTTFPLTKNRFFTHSGSECRLKRDQGWILDELGDKAGLGGNALE